MIWNPQPPNPHLHFGSLPSSPLQLDGGAKAAEQKPSQLPRRFYIPDEHGGVRFYGVQWSEDWCTLHAPGRPDCPVNHRLYPRGEYKGPANAVFFDGEGTLYPPTARARSLRQEVEELREITFGSPPNDILRLSQRLDSLIRVLEGRLGRR
jgi:hypothetical protein